MKRYLLTTTLLVWCALSYAQEGLTLEEVKAMLSSMEEQSGPSLKDPFPTFGPSYTEELQLTVAERDDDWLQEEQEWSPQDSVKFFYDELGRETATETLEYSFGEWNVIERSTNAFNDQGLVDTTLIEINQQGEWQLDERDIITYDDDGNVLEDRTEVWDGEEWQVESRRISLYDAEGRISERKAESWDGSTWHTTTLSAYEYDEETGNIVVFSTFNASPPDFVLQNADRSEYTYDEQERRATVVSYTGQGDEWVLNRRELYEYSSPDSELLERLVYENYVMDEWMPIFQLLYEYEEDLITVGYIEFWAADTEEWTPGIRYLYEYEQQGGQNRLKLRLTQSWIDSTAVYQDQSSFEYTYTEELEISVRKDYDQDQGMMVPNSRTLTYLAVIVDTEELPASIKGLHLYPNPNDGNFTLDVSDADLDISSTLQLRCTDLQGRNLINRTVDPAGGIMEVQLPALSSGLYILHLTDGQQIWRQRMIVRQ